MKTEEVHQELQRIRRNKNIQFAFDLTAILGLIALSAAIAVLFTQGTDRQELNKRQDVAIQQLTDELDQVCRQATPGHTLPASVQQSCDRAEKKEPPEILRGAPGAQGNPGLPGPPGASGAPGPPGSVGAPGPPGSEGKPGGPGGEGAPGESGASGADGKDGKDGKDGASGAPGPPGPPGPTCPEGFAAQPRSYDPTPPIGGLDPQPGDEETWSVCVKEG
jgi:hypothetical protein